MRALGLRPVQLTLGTMAGALIVLAYLLISTGLSGAETTETATNYSATATVTSTTPGAARGLSTTTSVPIGGFGNINFGNLLTFDPAATLTRGCNRDSNADGYADAFDNNADGDSLDGGVESEPCLKAADAAGALTSATVLGTLNSPCFTGFTIDFNLFAIPLPNNIPNPRASTNIAYTQPEGTSDRFNRWATTPVSGQDYVAVGGGTTVAFTGTVANADNIAFKNYPEYLLDIFDPDGETSAGIPRIPTAVYGGIARVAGSTTVPLYFAYFDPGTLVTSFPSPNPFSHASSNLGYMSQTVLNDPSQTGANPSTITAFCSTVATTTLLPTVGGITRATNPAAGTHFNLGWVASLRDLDNDGIEASLDTCPRNLEVDGSPREAGNDPDGDMIDSSCDPGATNLDDHDADGFLNTADNCPLAVNSSQAQVESGSGPAVGYSSGYAPDGGPLGDGLGDTCDSGSVSVTYNGLSHSISLSSSVGNGRWQAKGFVTPICYGGTDADSDGYCAEDAEDTDDGDAVLHGSWTLTPAFSAVLGDYGATGGSWDTDSGGSSTTGNDSDWIETYVGTDARQPCSLDTLSTIDDPTNEPLSHWVFDFNTDQDANFSDILPISPHFNEFATDAEHRRFDWNVDGFVDFGDILAITPVFNDTCVPVVGPQ